MPLCDPISFIHTRGPRSCNLIPAKIEFRADDTQKAAGTALQLGALDRASCMLSLLAMLSTCEQIDHMPPQR